MEPGEYRPPGKKRRRRCLIISVVAAVVVIIILGVVLGVSLRPNTDELKQTFTDRCKAFKEYDCEKIWDVFVQAFVGKDPCNVPMEAYNPLIDAAPFKPACNRMMFWSKTKNVVHDFTDKRDCYVTLEDTLLGSVMDGLNWCGKEGSQEIFTTGCPGWTDCEKNPVRSFWNRASAAFADVACGDVSAMLNGSIATPFSPSSIFATIELVRFNSTRVKSLNVVLVTQKTEVTDCTNPSLKDLQKELDQGIKYKCTEVSESRIEACGADPQIPCGGCW
ncbi:ADP-ribosyl cyclase/cyclic ADP-ribose hydrolase 1-like [Sphaeramia orbicularis]|uniref:ADP-ribosyl cyclase/cyclic ADP-ribose hydrolase n=1 Tax=Sphaeramia orbicularis TaxID=375764 RepID=A0A672Z139_9TELE|nr:ADP-ribosyl cyclase/cyclic ADP-ribose hydrolase 1-like [Sphaeramia orbicularis]